MQRQAMGNRKYELAYRSSLSGCSGRGQCLGVNTSRKVGEHFHCGLNLVQANPIRLFPSPQVNIQRFLNIVEEANEIENVEGNGCRLWR